MHERKHPCLALLCQLRIQLDLRWHIFDIVLLLHNFPASRQVRYTDLIHGRVAKQLLNLLDRTTLCLNDEEETDDELDPVADHENQVVFPAYCRQGDGID